MKLLAVGDTHLCERSGLGPERLQDQERVWAEILELAVEEDVDAIAFLGDAFEHRRPTPAELRAFQRPLARFRRISDTPILALVGNHDVENADRPTALELFSTYMDVHRKPGLWECGDVTVATLPWSPVFRLVAENGGGDRDAIHERAGEILVNVARGLRAEVDGPAVLLLHWSISGAALPSGLSIDMAREPILDCGELEDLGFEAVVAGHVHRAQLLSGGVGDLAVTGSAGLNSSQTSAFCDPAPTGERRSVAAASACDPVRPPMLYVGSPLPLDHGESSCEHGVWVLDTETWEARFVALVSRPFLTYDFTAEEAESLLDAGCGMPELPLADAVVRLRYTATQDEARRIDNAALRRALLDAGAWRATVEPTVVREESARVASMTAELDETAALELYLRENRIERRESLLEVHARYVGEAA